MYVNESIFIKYADLDYKDKVKENAFFDKKIIRKCAGLFATITMLGIGGGIAHNRLEQQQIKQDLSTVIANGDYSALNHINYANKQQTINRINNITSEFLNIIDPIMEQNRRAENYISYHSDEQSTSDDFFDNSDFDNDLNSKNMKKAYILTHEIKKIYNAIKDKNEYKDIKDSVFIKMTKIVGDYNTIIKSESFEMLFSPSSYFLKNTMIDTERVSFDEWQDKLAKENIKPYGNSMNFFVQKKIGDYKNEINIKNKKYLNNTEHKNIADNVNNLMYDIDSNVINVSDSISDFRESFNVNAKKINDTLNDIKKEGKIFNQKVYDYHHKLEHNYDSIEKNYHEVEKSIKMIF